MVAGQVIKTITQTFFTVVITKFPGHVARNTVSSLENFP